MISQQLEKTRFCLDNNAKSIIRIFDWNGKFVEFALCKKCSIDSDFSNFISETKIKKEVIKQ